jgi:hypothetical protein
MSHVLIVPPKRAKRTRWLLLVLLAVACSLLVGSSADWQVQSSQTVFEIELPEFGIAPSSLPELTIPSSNVGQVFVHILRPVADNVDYSAIRTSINGHATATISEIVSGVRGKLVKMNLKLFSGFEFVGGRNTVEVWVQNRRGRTYYASFVLRTATENRSEDFVYHVQHATDTMQSVPPELVLLEPERAIEFPPSRKSMVVRISGVATAVTAIKRVSVDGRNVALKSGAPVAARSLGLTNEDKQVFFETIMTVNSGSPPIVVEAEDNTGTRTQVSVPVITRRSEPVTQMNGRRYALIIGISKYKNTAEGIPNLQYADEDARVLHQFLQQPSAGQFSPDDMLLLMNEQATIANIRQALGSFIGKATANDLLVIFIAGHGAADPSAPQNLYVLANDTSIANMPETALPMPDLRKYVEQNVRAKRVLMLVDTCHSAGLSTEITRGLTNNLINLYLEKMLYQDEGRAIITSSDVNELSRESQRWGQGHGVFTYYLLEGLKGKADSNEDRLVTVGELFHFVRQKVRLDTQFKQNPRMLVGANENIALAVARSQK